MNSIEPRILKGFRDFLPQEALKRQYVIALLKEVFLTFGFAPLETPALEYEEILTEKYGDEGDTLLYRFEDNGKRRVALRYDQTVPLARVVAQYGSTSSPEGQPLLIFPFKRYQIQPVWRAENTQKGRYREFLQCDVDIVGSTSPLSDAELLGLVYTAYQKLGLEIVIKINDRSLLSGIEPKYLAAIDKLEKIGEQEVIKELQQKGLSIDEAWGLYTKCLNFNETEALQNIRDLYEQMGYPSASLVFDSLMVRGLDYYTGIILEIVLPFDTKTSSLGGGGRYDNLIGMFTNKQVPAVGFAFGFDRIINAMEALNLFPTSLQTTSILVTIFSPALKEKSIELSSQLRTNNINTELYLDEHAKMEKQLKYADQKGIPFVAFIGPEEVTKNIVKIKNMQTREQKEVSFDELVSMFRI